MKELKVTQNQVGQFNLLSNEKSLSFYMGIYEDGKIMERDGIQARLHYSGDADEQPIFDDPVDNIDQVLRLCFKYARNIISTTDYLAQTILFARIYNECYDELNSAFVSFRQKELDAEIERLEKERNHISNLWDITDTVNSEINKEIKSYQQRVEYTEKKMADLIPNSESWDKENKCLEKYNNKIADLKQNLLTPAE